MTIVWVILALIVIAFLYIITIYNSLVTLRNRTEEALSDIDVQLKRRYDLIPNLIETVKGYAEHEKELLENVTKARTEAMGAQDMEGKAKAENMLSDTLKSLFAVAENYPDLKANQNFLALQAELSDTENKIAAARRFYNSNVRDLNIRIEKFPSNMVASSLNIKKHDLFEIEIEAERKVPEVKF